MRIRPSKPWRIIDARPCPDCAPLREQLRVNIEERFAEARIFTARIDALSLELSTANARQSTLQQRIAELGPDMATMLECLAELRTRAERAEAQVQRVRELLVMRPCRHWECGTYDNLLDAVAAALEVRE